jgi:predicted phage tail protein
MLKQIKLYGELADEYGKDWALDVNSPSEAVRALCANNPSFKKFITSSQDRGVGYKVMVGKSYIENNQVDLYNPSGKQEIKIIPVVLGAKSKFLKQIFLGALLIWAAPLAVNAIGATSMGGAVLGTTAAGLDVTLATMAGTAMTQVGWNLVIGGVGGLLAPSPEEEVDSYLFDGAVNTTRQGVPVPICYGQLMVGGAVISSGVISETSTA